MEFGNTDKESIFNRFILGDEEFKTETLYAYELGFRSQVSSTVFMDVSGFYFEYKDLRTFDVDRVFDLSTVPQGDLAFTYMNDANGYSSGMEAVVEWKVLRNLSINVQYSYINFTASPDSDVPGDGVGVIVFEEQEVNNIAALRCEYTFDGGVEFDVGVNYSHWTLIEEPIYLAKVIASIEPPQCILVDCLTLWVTNLLLKEDGSLFQSEKELLLDAIKNTRCHLILVSNETGMGIIPLGEISRRFVDESGWLHQEIAAIADQVTLSVAGLPHLLKTFQQ